jgi:acyl dehydratase
MAGKYFEDFQVGARFVTAGRTITEPDIMSFIGLAGIYEELYTNHEYIARETLFKRRFAPGPLTFALAEGLVLQTGLFHHTGLAFLEMQMKFVAPVFLGDTIKVEVEVTHKRETRHPDRGIVTFAHTVRKQTGEVAVEMTKVRMIRRRPAGPGSGGG